jgi:hypothetical protein
MLQLLLALIVVAQTPEPSGVAQIRRDAKVMAPHVTTDLARDFLRAGSALPEIHDRTLYQDVAKKTYLSEKAVQKLEAATRDRLKKIPVDETFYYNTRYGSPLAYARPLELLGRSGLHDLSGRKILDLGMSDREVLKALFAALKPGGRLMIFNLGPAPNAPKEPYRPMADIRCPFPHDALEAAGFVVEAFNRDDTRAAREMGADLGWNKGEGAMDLEKDLFASYSLVRKP